MEDNHSFDIAVIGGGAGGLFVSAIANTLGAKTCIIEKKKLGGDCTWYGCMPSKAILKSAEAAHLFKRFLDFGIKVQSEFNLDVRNVMPHVRDVINEIAEHHKPEDLEERGIKVIFGSPRFTGPGTSNVNGQTVNFKRAVICTGSHPMVPPIEGLENIDYLTNETIFDLEELPRSLVVLGGGPIGIELSQAMNRLGSQVTLLEMFTILSKEDPELVKFLEERLKKEKLNIITGKKAIKVTSDGNQIIVTLQDKDGRKEEVSAQKLLVAVGRVPNTSGLDLEKGGIEYTPKGIKVNDYLQTTNKNVFACGDVVGPYQFSHVASYQGSVCVRNALFRRLAWQKVNYENITWCTFTSPELAHLGLTEDQAKKKYGTVKVYKSPYTKSDRAITDVEKEGLVKIVTDKKNRILGAHIVGAHAGELIQGLLIAKSQKISLEKLAQTLFIYPTLSELIKKTAALPFVEKGSNPLVKFLMKAMKSI